CPDVSVTKSTSTPVISAGATASYSVSVTAGGSGSSANVVLTDALPSGLNWTVAGPDAAACAPTSPVAGGTTLTCSFGTMAAGTSKAIVLNAVTTAASCPGISNTATVSASSDTNSGNNSAGPIAITVNCPDVSVSLTTSTPTIVAGTNADYAITVTAGGPGSSTNVVLTDPLPAGLGWTGQGPAAGACSISSGVLTCSFGTVSQGATPSVTLTAPTSAQSCGSISNTASVSATVDTNAGNNTSGPVSIAINCPDVSVTK